MESLASQLTIAFVKPDQFIGICVLLILLILQWWFQFVHCDVLVLSALHACQLIFDQIKQAN